MKICLERVPDLIKSNKLLRKKIYDDPRYKFYFNSDYYSEIVEDGCWLNDAFGIMLEDECVGTISWQISRNNNAVHNVAVIVEPDYLKSGVGVAAMVIWLDYHMTQRNTRKISFSCIDGNPAKRIYDKITECGGRYVGCRTKHVKLMDGKYCGLHLYEILGEEFSPSKLFSRALKSYKQEENMDNQQANKSSRLRFNTCSENTETKNTKRRIRSTKRLASNV